MTSILRNQAQRTVITGVGAVSPLGHNATTSFAALRAGQSGAAPITLFDAARFPTTFACEVKGWVPEDHLDKKRVKELDRYSEFAVVAANEAIAQAGLVIDSDAAAERAGCILGTGMGGLLTIQAGMDRLRAGHAKVSAFTIPAAAPNLAAGQISIEHNLQGPSFALASACATGAHAIGEAALMIRHGRADVVVVGCAEAVIAETTFAGFSSMRALSRKNDEPTRASRAFDSARDGFVCGEGAGVVVLERLDRALARGANILAEVTGYGATSDAHHIAAPQDDGRGSRRAMQLALADANLAPNDVGHISAHATSTPLGDLAEARAIAAVFGEHTKNVAVSALKSMIGHSLGAAGALAAVATVQSLVQGVLLPSINLDDVDPAVAALGLDVVTAAREAVVHHALINAFGFGGTNATLVLSRYASV